MTDPTCVEVEDYNKTKRDVAERMILNLMIGIHFTPEQAENIKKYLEAHTITVLFPDKKE